LSTTLATLLFDLGATARLADAENETPSEKSRSARRGAPSDSAPSDGGDEDAARGWDRYREIVERNIFSRNRRPYRRGSRGQFGRGPDGGEESPTGESESRPRSPDDPGRKFLLVGVSKVGGRPFALFENTRDGTVSFVARGDTIGERKLTAISLDHVEYKAGEDGEKNVSIAIGRTLTGETALAATSSPSPPTRRRPVRGPSRGPSRGSRPGRTPGPGSERGPARQPEAEKVEAGTPGESERAGESVLERMLRRRREGR
ncbi:MAG: hypothetical protein O7J95_20225, partial [Planctomycetota bacterium]|nr:hypothetical protein [Planctomycetota bacterium]